MTDHKRILLATKNDGKVREFQAMLAPLGYTVLNTSALDDGGIEVDETGSTFAENACLKAHTYAKRYRMPVLADDSGLEVPVLHNEPGVYSARYAGSGATDAQNNAKLLRELQSVPENQRQARYVCVIAYVADEQAPAIFARGECTGYIVSKARGSGGFGYDPLFYVPEIGKTMAEISAETKNRMSHRFHALQELFQLLKDK